MIYSLGYNTATDGSLELIVSMRRHSYKDGDKLTPEGIEWAKKKGAEELRWYDGKIEYAHSPSHRTYETAKYIAEGSGKKGFRAKKDRMLNPLTNEEDKSISDVIKKEGKESFLDNLLNRKTDYHRKLYETFSKSLIEYIRDAIKQNLGYKGRKRIETISHNTLIDSSLAEILRRNGKEVNGSSDLGGEFKECDKYEIYVSRNSDGKLMISVKYKGGEAKVSAKSLGLTEAQAAELEAEMEAMEKESQASDEAATDDSDADTSKDEAEAAA